MWSHRTTQKREKDESWNLVLFVVQYHYVLLDHAHQVVSFRKLAKTKPGQVVDLVATLVARSSNGLFGR